MMLGQMQVQTPSCHAQVQRQISFETVLELDLEAQKVQEELAGLGFVENSQDGYGPVEADRCRSSGRQAG